MKSAKMRKQTKKRKAKPAKQPAFVNRDNTYANWVAGMARMRNSDSRSTWPGG